MRGCLLRDGQRASCGVVVPTTIGKLTSRAVVGVYESCEKVNFGRMTPIFLAAPTRICIHLRLERYTTKLAYVLTIFSRTSLQRHLPRPNAQPLELNLLQNITTPTCDSEPVNLNQSYATSIQNTADYDIALNFPIMDIMTFFPIVDSQESRVQGSRAAEIRMMCLRPDGAAEGSRQARTAREVLDGIDGLSGSGSGESGAVKLDGKSMEGLVVAMAVIFVLNM
jgi:hypothetical protein